MRRTSKFHRAATLLLAALLLVAAPSEIWAVAGDGATRPAAPQQEGIGVQYFLETTYADALESYQAAGYQPVSDVEITITRTGRELTYNGLFQVARKAGIK